MKTVPAIQAPKAAMRFEIKVVKVVYAARQILGSKRFGIRSDLRSRSLSFINQIFSQDVFILQREQTEGLTKIFRNGFPQAVFNKRICAIVMRGVRRV